MVVPDNERTGVTKACYYEPELNPTYEEMAGCHADWFAELDRPALQPLPDHRKPTSTTTCRSTGTATACPTR